VSACVVRSDNREIAMVEGGDPVDVQALGQRDHTGVGTAQSKVCVLDDELSNSLPVNGDNRLDEKRTIDD